MYKSRKLKLQDETASTHHASFIYNSIIEGEMILSATSSIICKLEALVGSYCMFHHKYFMFTALLLLRFTN